MIEVKNQNTANSENVSSAMARARKKVGRKKLESILKTFGATVVIATGMAITMPGMTLNAFQSIKRQKAEKELQVLKDRSSQAEARRILTVQINNDGISALENEGFKLSGLPKNGEFDKDGVYMKTVSVNNDDNKEIGALLLNVLSVGNNMKLNKGMLIAYEGDKGDQKLLDFAKQISAETGEQICSSELKMFENETYEQYRERENSTYDLMKKAGYVRTAKNR